MVRLVFGTDGIAAAPRALARLAREPGLRLSLLDFTESYPEARPVLARGPAAAPGLCLHHAGLQQLLLLLHRALCARPQKSRSLPSILEECTSLAQRGAREVTLLGQNVNSYGLDASGDGTSFAALLDAVAAVPGLERIRFTTSHPKDLDDAVIARFADLPQLCPALHLPVQSGSDDILRRMGRRYDTAAYLTLVEQTAPGPGRTSP